MTEERIVRAEKVHKAGWPRHEGWLELTPTRLVFRPIRTSGTKAAVELPLSKIEGARAKKGFGSGSEELEVVYRDDSDRRRSVRFERMSWAAWSNDVLKGTGRAEPNSFAAFERDIADIRTKSPDIANPRDWSSYYIRGGPRACRPLDAELAELHRVRMKWSAEA